MAKNKLSKTLRNLLKSTKTGITPKDKATSNELSKMTDGSSQSNIPTLPIITKDTLSPGDAKTLMSEETQRTKIDTERKLDVEEAYTDEMKRRENFNEMIKLKKDIFHLKLKKEYRAFVGERHIKDGDESSLQADINLRREQIEKKENDLKERSIRRLEREQLRKKKENSFRVNKVTVKQDFFENEIKVTYEEKKLFNPEIENLTPIEQRRKQLIDLEEKLGRRISTVSDMMLNQDGKMVLIRENMEGHI